MDHTHQPGHFPAYATENTVFALTVEKAGHLDTHLIGKTMLLTGNSFHIGRQDVCDLHIHDPLFSRQHARLMDTSGAWCLYVTGLNGLYLNGRKLTSESTIAVLCDGDELALHDYVFRFHAAQKREKVEHDGPFRLHEGTIPLIGPLVEKGVFPVSEDFSLHPATTLEDVQAQLEKDPGLGKMTHYDSLPEVYYFTPSATLSCRLINMRVSAIFDNGKLTSMTLRPTNLPSSPYGSEADRLEAAYRHSCIFLEALIGATECRYPWGRIRTYLEPDYHDSYHGGYVYVDFD